MNESMNQWTNSIYHGVWCGLVWCGGGVCYVDDSIRDQDTYGNRHYLRRVSTMTPAVLVCGEILYNKWVALDQQ